MNHLLGTVQIIVAVRIQQLVEKNVKNGPPNFHIDIILQVWEIITTVVIQMALLKCGAIQLIEEYEENLANVIIHLFNFRFTLGRTKSSRMVFTDTCFDLFQPQTTSQNV